VLNVLGAAFLFTKLDEIPKQLQTEEKVCALGELFIWFCIRSSDSSLLPNPSGNNFLVKRASLFT
jgi:hypothetical protein